jgi:hypothetical protein
MVNKNQLQSNRLSEIFENPKFRLYSSLGIILFFYIIYITRDLFFVNNLNDFGEYFLRASQWANGNWYWGSGNDKLLSFFEYLPVKYFGNDFNKIYKFTQILIISFLMLSLLIFLLRKNIVLPDFRIRFFAVVFLLTMPFFIVESVTVEQGILLTASVILFISTYNLPYMGIVGLIAYLSRPEGLIIIPLYFIFLWIDKASRKKTFINFLSFLVIFAIYKWFDIQYLNQGTTIISSYESHVFSKETIQESGNIFVFILGALYKLIKIPVIVFIYAMSICQNYILMVFFLVGVFFGWKDRKLFVFYGILIFYVLMGYLRVAFKFDLLNIPQMFKLFFGIQEFVNETIKISNGRETELAGIGHSRYFLFLYPAVAVFVVSGILYSVNLFTIFTTKSQASLANTNFKKGGKITRGISKIKTNEKKPILFFERLYAFPKDIKTGSIALGIIFSIVLLNNIYAYSSLSEKYSTSTQKQDIYFTDFYHVALKIRESRHPNDIVMMANVCNCNESFIQEFEVFSGTQFLLMNMCENCLKWPIKNHPEKRGDIDIDEIKQLNPSMTVLLDYIYIDYKKSFSKSTIEKSRKLFEKFELNMLDSLNVRYLVTQQEIKYNSLSLISKFGNMWLYQNSNARKLENLEFMEAE